MQSLLIGAHRGAMCHAPENTLAAFEKAIDFRTYRIEMDVRGTRDGHIVVMHDETVDRTTNGTGRVRDLTLEELRRLGVGGSEQVPTLGETLACVRGRSKLLVELKDSDITEEVVQQINEAGMTDQCTLSSFDEECLSHAWKLCPELSRASFFVKPGVFSASEVIERLGVDMVIVWPQAATPENISEAKRHGLHVRCGFRDDLTYDQAFAVVRDLAAMGVDEYSCGRPDWLGEMIEAIQAETDS